MKKNLLENEQRAIVEYKRKIGEKFGAAEVFLFGSKVRGEGDIYSDIDLLVVLDREVNNSIEEEIFDVGYEIELEYDVIFGVIVYSKEFLGVYRKSNASVQKYQKRRNQGVLSFTRP
jgi:predicted nucleotidyltransferase